jgi:N-acetylmuramoyl-L-alanine amidase
MDPEDEEEKKKKKVIGIDPGHGDQHKKNKQVDPGAVSGETYEKDAVLTMANAATEALQDAGYSVTQTRTGDVKVDAERLQWRIDMTKDSSMFVSIHTNSSVNENANGVLVLHNAQGTDLAEAISGSIDAFSNNSGIQQNNSLFVLRKFSGPAVLIEAGYLSNKADREVITNQGVKIGKQIGAGIIRYIDRERK